MANKGAQSGLYAIFEPKCFLEININTCMRKALTHAWGDDCIEYSVSLSRIHVIFFPVQQPLEHNSLVSIVAFTIVQANVQYAHATPHGPCSMVKSLKSYSMLIMHMPHLCPHGHAMSLCSPSLLFSLSHTPFIWHSMCYCVMEMIIIELF